MKEFFQRLAAFVVLLSMIVLLLPHTEVSAVYENGYDGGRSGDGIGIYAHGVDLSEWQGGEIDFNKIKEQGYSFVILRAGFSVYIDEYFERNYAAAKDAGLNVGVYLYSYADTVEEVLREADALKGWLSDKTLEYPVYYDMEEPETHGKMSASALTELSMSFLDSMAADGWLVGLYSCKSWLDSKLETEKICAQYECWMALYLPSGSFDTYERYDEYCGMWQYSSTGTVDGVPGNVDMNVAFKDYPSICRQYGFNGYVASGENLMLVGASEIPKVIACGESIPINGRVISNEGKLTNVTVGIYDALGNQLTGRSAGPRSESYDISTLASGVKTSTLPEGSYIYRVTATNSRGTQVLYQQEIVISAAGVMAVAVTAPQDIAEGTNYVPQGEVHASTSLREVWISITSENGTEVLKASVQPNTTAYALPMLSSELNTQALSMGEYNYCVSVRTDHGTQTILNEPFNVWVKDDPLTLNGLVLQSEYHLNELLGLSGTIVSEKSALREVTVSISNRNEEESIRAATAQGGREISLTHLNDALDLETLSYGSYVCKIVATNDAGPVILAEETFVIRPDGLSLCDFRAPTTLYQGDSFQLSGAIASDDSPLKFISVAVIDENHQILFDAAVTANVFVYDLSELTSKLLFSSLDAGEYMLRIRAENAVRSEVLYNSCFNVTAESDRIEWIDSHCSPNGISYPNYDVMQFYGTINSAQSVISSVKAEIFSEEGVVMNAAQLQPMNHSVDIDAFNDVLRLSALSVGNYRLVITAENAAGEFAMLDEPFTISACSHRNVRSGVVHEQRCDRVGAICDSRCSDCGERVQKGIMIQADAHVWTNGSCMYCGKAEMQSFTLYESQTFKHNGRYMIAYCNEGEWYALDMLGRTVAISAPNADGSITASAALLWTPIVRGQELRLINPFGLALHLDSERISVASGMRNSCFEYIDGHLQLSLGEEQRCLAFENDVFQSGTDPVDILIYELTTNNMH